MIWGHLAAAVVSLGASLLLSRLRPEPEPRRRGLIRESSQPARWILGRARAGGLLAYYHEDAEAFQGATMEPGDDFRSVHLAIAVAEGACDALEGVYFDDLYYPLTAHSTDTDNAQIYDCTSRRPPYSGAAGNLFEIRSCFAADGTQGDTLRLRARIPTGDFLDGISWVHVVLTQPPNADDPDRIHKWSALPRIEFAVRGLRVPPATDPSAAAVWTDDATDLRRWHLTARRNIPAAAIDTASVTASRAITNEMIMAELDGTYWRYATRPAPPNVPGSGWGTAEVTPTQATPIAWVAWSPKPITGVGTPPPPAEREWVLFPWRVRKTNGDIVTVGQRPGLVSADIMYLLGSTGYRERRYSFNGIIGGNRRPAEVDAEMDFAMQGGVDLVDGMWRFRPGADAAPAMVWDAEDAISRAVDVGPPLDEGVNAASMSLEQSRIHDYGRLDLPIIRDDAEIMADGAEVPAKLRAAGLINHPITGGRILATFLRRARQNVVYTYEAPVTSEWLQRRPSDVVTVTDDYYGATARRMVLTAITFRRDATVSVTLVDAPAGAYADTVDIPDDRDDRPVNIGVPPAPDNVAVDVMPQLRGDGTTYPLLRVTWDQKPYRTEIRWRAIDIGGTIGGGMTNLPETTALSPVGLRRYSLDMGFAMMNRTNYLQETVSGPPLDIDAEVWNTRWEVQARHLGKQRPGPWSTAVRVDAIPTIMERVTGGEAVNGRRMGFYCDAPVRTDIAEIEIAAGETAQPVMPPSAFSGTRYPVVPGTRPEFELDTGDTDTRFRTDPISSVQARWVTRSGAVGPVATIPIVPASLVQLPDGWVVLRTTPPTDMDAGIRGRLFATERVVMEP